MQVEEISIMTSTRGQTTLNARVEKPTGIGCQQIGLAADVTPRYSKPLETH